MNTHTMKQCRHTLPTAMKGKGKQKMTAVLAYSKTIISVLTYAMYVVQWVTLAVLIYGE